MKSLVLDTNVVLRFLMDDIADQTEKATDLFTKAKSKKLDVFVPQIVIFEIFFALDKYYKFPKDQVINKLGTILATSYLHIQDKMVFQETLELFKRKNIDFVDCFLICQSKAKESDLFTFDKDLQKLLPDLKKHI